MRVAIVNDLKIAIEALRRAVTSDPQHEIAWTAIDGNDAIRKCQTDRPDIILMDLIMPGLDGAQTTQEIMRRTPCPILVVTATVTGNYSLVYDALGYGAYDAVNTPSLASNGTVQGATELLAKIAKVKNSLAERPLRSASDQTTIRPSTSPLSVGNNIVLLGASTGGPQALLTILQEVSRLKNTSIWIAQHIGSDFLQGLAEWLAQRVGAPVRIAKLGDGLDSAGIFLLPSEPTLVVGSNQQLQIARHTPPPVHTPDINQFFHSVAHHSGKRGIAALLTGMGSDGAHGLLSLRQAGWYTIAQDETTSTVYGMPQVAKQLGAAHQIMPLPSIGASISTFIQNSRS